MSATARSREHARQFVHMLMGGFALLLRYLSWWEAAALAGAALAFNRHVLPRVGGSLYRPDETTRRRPSGIVLYPLSVLLLILTFPYRPDIVAAAWGVLALGDGMATLVGHAWGRTRIPWNREKTLEGSAAFFFFGGLAGAALCWWCRPPVIPPPYLMFSLGAPFVAAFVAALVESIPVRLDDNVSVPLSAAATMWVLSLVSADMAAEAARHAVQTVPFAVGLNCFVAWAGYRARTVSPSGAFAGVAIGSAIFVSAGWAGWTLLLLTFAAAAVSSRLGLRRKTLLGIAEERGGRRGAGNAVANTGVAAVAALMSALTYAHAPSMVAFAAALAAGGSDTMASEIGKAWGRHAFLVPTFRRVPPGTSGAVSLEGTAAGLLGAIGLAAAAAALRLVPADALLPIVAGATIGSFVESLLGATLEGPGILNNDLLNFLNTAIAAFAAVTIAGALA